MRTKAVVATQDRNKSWTVRGRLQVVAETDPGLQRSQNEDSFYVDEATGLLLVADGFGGHADGEIASREATLAIASYLSQYSSHNETQPNHGVRGFETPPVELPRWVGSAICDSFDYANKNILQLSQQLGHASGFCMASTVVGLWMYGSEHESVAFSVGDSRAYRFRNGELVRLSRDHTIYQIWSDNGSVGNPPARNVLLKALGIADTVVPDITSLALQSGDIVLLCTDGLTAMVPDEIIGEALSNTRPSALNATCRELIALANAAGGTDNITLILASFT